MHLILATNRAVGSSNLSGRAISASRAMWSVRPGDHSVVLLNHLPIRPSHGGNTGSNPVGSTN